MKKRNVSITKAKQSIQRVLNKLLIVQLAGKSALEFLSKLEDKLTELDKSNPDYYNILNDEYENNKIKFIFVVLVSCLIVDFFLLRESLTILCQKFNLPAVLTIVVPTLFITIEVIISFFSSLESRDEDKSTFIGKQLPYLVIIALFGLSLTAVFFYAQLYNSNIDGSSFWSYMSDTIIVQSILLVSSIMMHLWLIRNSEEIGDAFAYSGYRIKRSKIVSKIEKIKKLISTEHIPEFSKLTYEFAKKDEAFKVNFPDLLINWANSIPAELIEAINRVMGWKLMKPDNQAPDPDKQE